MRDDRVRMAYLGEDIGAVTVCGASRGASHPSGPDAGGLRGWPLAGQSRALAISPTSTASRHQRLSPSSTPRSGRWHGNHRALLVSDRAARLDLEGTLQGAGERGSPAPQPDVPVQRPESCHDKEDRRSSTPRAPSTGCGRPAIGTADGATRPLTPETRDGAGWRTLRRRTKRARGTSTDGVGVFRTPQVLAAETAVRTPW